MSADPTYKAADFYVQQCLETFEDILQACSDDAVAMEALTHIPEATEEADRMRLRVIQFAEVAVRTGNMRHVMPLLYWLARFTGSHDDAVFAIKRLRDTMKGNRPNAYAELLMVDRMFQLKMLSSVDDLLQEIGSISDQGEDEDRPFCVLRSMQQRGADEFERILVRVSDDAGLPLVPLEMFHPQSGAYSTLPMEFPLHRGAIPFDTMSDELLVAVLNPYDVLLRADVCQQVGRPCHFYLASPANYDDALRYICRQTA